MYIKKLSINDSLPVDLGRINLFYIDSKELINKAFVNITKALELLSINVNNFDKPDILLHKKDCLAHSENLSNILLNIGVSKDIDVDIPIDLEFDSLIIKDNNSCCFASSNRWDSLQDIEIINFNKYKERDIEELSCMDNILSFYINTIESFSSKPGIVFIQELERYFSIHQHSEVFYVLTNSFPQHQFFISTSSPWIVGDSPFPIYIVSNLDSYISGKSGVIKEYKGYGKLYSQIQIELLGLLDREIYMKGHIESLHNLMSKGEYNKASNLLDYISKRMDTDEPYLLEVKTKLLELETTKLETLYYDSTKDL